MTNKILCFIAVIPLIALTACEDSNDDAPTETGRAIPDVSVSCTNPSTSAECDTASDGDLVYFVWTTESCEDFSGDAEIAAINSQSAACTTGNCAAASSGDWMANDSTDVVPTIPSGATTAAVWMDLVDHTGDDEGPESGDVFCCADNVDGAAALTDADCDEIP